MNINRLVSCRNGACFSLQMTTACLFSKKAPETLVVMDDESTENIIDNDADRFIATHALSTIKTYTSVCFQFRKQISTSFGVHRYLIGQNTIFPMTALPFSMCWSYGTFFAHEVFREAYKSFTNDFPVSCFDKGGNLIHSMTDYGFASNAIDEIVLHETIIDAYAEAIIKMYKSRKFEPLF
jgi:hypothetical protein